VLLRLAYLGVTNAFALLRLLPRSDRDKDAEILTLRHQITVLQRQLGAQQVRFEPTDRALLAALLRPLPRPTLQGLRFWYAPTPSCAGTATSSPAGTPLSRVPAGAAGHAPSTPSGPWRCAWPGRTPAGDIDEYTANCSCSA